MELLLAVIVPALWVVSIALSARLCWLLGKDMLFPGVLLVPSCLEDIAPLKGRWLRYLIIAVILTLLFPLVLALVATSLVVIFGGFVVALIALVDAVRG